MNFGDYVRSKLPSKDRQNQFESNVGTEFKVLLIVNNTLNSNVVNVRQ